MKRSEYIVHALRSELMSGAESFSVVADRSIVQQGDRNVATQTNITGASPDDKKAKSKNKAGGKRKPRGSA